MPDSDSRTRKAALRLIFNKIPNRVLDIGVGSGFYGKILKEVNPSVEVYGLEIFPKYITDHLSYYKTIFLCDARKFEYEMLSNIDLVVAADVLEHFNKEETVAVIKKLQSLYSWMIITMPINVVVNGIVFYMPQGEVAGNPNEAHLSEWTLDEITSLGFKHIEGGLTKEYIPAVFEWKK